MINIIFLIIIACTFLIEILSGMGRGWKRGLVKLSIVLFSGIVSLLLKGLFIDTVLNIKINGMNVVEKIQSLLPSYLSPAYGIISALYIIVASLVLYYACYIVLIIINEIVYLIIKKKIVKEGDPKYTDKENKSFWDKINSKPAKFIGGSLVGLFVAIAVSAFVFAPLSGLVGDISNISKVMNVTIKDKTVAEYANIDSSFVAPFTEYKDSSACKIYDSIGGKIYGGIINAGSNQLNNIDIDAFISSIEDLAKLISKVSEISEINFDDGLTDEVIDKISIKFAELEEIKGNIDKDTIDTLNSLISDSLSELGLNIPFNLNDFDLSKVNFINESELISTAKKLSSENMDEVNSVDIDETIEKLSQSTLILPILDSSNVKINLPSQEKKDEVKSAIDNLGENCSEETKNKLTKLFNLNENSEKQEVTEQ